MIIILLSIFFFFALVIIVSWIQRTLSSISTSDSLLEIEMRTHERVGVRGRDPRAWWMMIIRRRGQGSEFALAIFALAAGARRFTYWLVLLRRSLLGGKFFRAIGYRVTRPFLEFAHILTVWYKVSNLAHLGWLRMEKKNSERKLGKLEKNWENLKKKKLIKFRKRFFTCLYKQVVHFTHLGRVRMAGHVRN